MLALLALLAAASLAAAPAEAPAPRAKEPLVCRGSERSLGSHIRSSSRCRTVEQWHAEDEAKARLPATLRVTEGQRDGTTRDRPQ